MVKKLILRNQDVKRVLVGVPKGHKHVRVIVELSNGTLFVFHEATIANITRAFINVITHPQKKAVELICTKLERRKRGFAEYQLIENPREDEVIIDEITEVILNDSTHIPHSLV